MAIPPAGTQQLADGSRRQTPFQWSRPGDTTPGTTLGEGILPRGARADHDHGPTAMKRITAPQRAALVLTDADYGLTVVETDTGLMLVYYGATTGWTPPWSTSWGVVARAASASAVAAFTTTPTDLTGLTAAYTLLATRRYELRASAGVTDSAGGATELGRVDIVDGSANVVGIDRQVMPYAATAVFFHIVEAIPDGTAGSKQFKVRAFREGGAGNLTSGPSATRPNVVSLVDVGPNGVPA